MSYLILGLILFLGVHSTQIVGLRDPLKRTMGAGPYKIVHSLISAAGLILIVYGKVQAHPSEFLWAPPGWTRHLALTVVPIAFVIFVSTYTPGHIRRLTRHPMTFAVVLWSGAHLLANGESASMLLFGAFFVWAVLTYITALMRKEAPAEVKGWGGDITAVVIGLGVAGLILQFHMTLFGVAIIG